MRRWRVGTFSMGLLLIAIGIVLLSSLISGFPLVEALFKWWPVLLIIMGLEILAHIYFSKEEHPKVKYDVFSMFMIVVIAFTSFGVYTVSVVDLLPRVKAMVAGQDHSFSLKDRSIEIDAGIDKIVLELSNATFSFNGHKSGSIEIFGDGEIFTYGQEKIDALTAAENVVSRRIDNTLLVQFKELPKVSEFNQGVNRLKYTVILPPDIEVEIKRASNSWQQIELNSGALQRNMLVDNSGPIVVNADADANLNVEATLRENYQLGGNVEWVFEEDASNKRATLMLGEGKYKLYLFNRGEIEFKHIK